MPNTSPGITMPGIPTGGNFGYGNTINQVVYDQVTHTAEQPPTTGVTYLVQALQNQANNLLPTASWSMEDGLTSAWTGQGGSLANVVGPAHSGTHSMQFTGTGVIANGNLLFTNGGPNFSGYVLPASYIGQALCLSAWSYNPAAPLRSVHVIMAFYTAGGVLITPTYSGAFIMEVQNTWMLSPPLAVLVPPTANSVVCYCGGPGCQTTGEVRYFDDFALAPF